MHRSRLTTVVIDCDGPRYDAAVAFWGAALGAEPRAVGRRGRYTLLRGAGLDVMLQRVAAGEVGVHVDVETDDVEAEVRRLEALGARRRREERSWWVMEDPAGHAFCVIPPVSADWPAGAREWP